MASRAYKQFAERISEAIGKVNIPAKYFEGLDKKETAIKIMDEGHLALTRNGLHERTDRIVNELFKVKQESKFCDELDNLIRRSQYNLGLLFMARYEEGGKYEQFYNKAIEDYKLLLNAAEEVAKAERKIAPIREELGEPLTLYGIEVMR